MRSKFPFLGPKRPVFGDIFEVLGEGAKLKSRSKKSIFRKNGVFSGVGQAKCTSLFFQKCQKCHFAGFGPFARESPPKGKKGLFPGFQGKTAIVFVLVFWRSTGQLQKVSSEGEGFTPPLRPHPRVSSTKGGLRTTSRSFLNRFSTTSQSHVVIRFLW